MPLLQGCQFANPINNGQPPAVPAPIQAPQLAPNQGDHVFGDVIGMVETSLQNIFGGGQEWRHRFERYSQPAYEQWQAFNRFDLGHGQNPPVVQRNGLAEPDEHAHIFGGYSQRFQWSFCEIVCAGYIVNQESRQIGGGSRAWRTSVMSRFDDVLTRSVDHTALTAYLQNPGQIREVNQQTVSRHPAISWQEAREIANTSNGLGMARILLICNNFPHARANLEGMLMRFDGPTRTMQGNNWI